MGAVVLVITGAEALYADMGHFGRRPIRVSWFAVVFPALILNYLGQAALILDDPTAIANPFYLLAPGWARLPLVVLATVATVIASQAVISGAFSVSRQAVRLGYLPHLTVRHTSTRRERPDLRARASTGCCSAACWCSSLVFRSSNRLATAYGLAVTGTLLLTTTLFLMYAAHRLAMGDVEAGPGRGRVRRRRAHLPRRQPHQDRPRRLAAAARRGDRRHRHDDLAARAAHHHRPPRRGRGPAARLRRDAQHRARSPGCRAPRSSRIRRRLTAPLALRANVAFNHVLHERVVIVSVLSENVPHVPLEERLCDRRPRATPRTGSCTWRPGSGSRTSRTSRRCCGRRADSPPSSTSIRTRRRTSCPA